MSGKAWCSRIRGRHDVLAVMKTPSHILSSMQGRFQWGPDGRNCLTTIEAFAKEYLPDYTPIYTRWLEMSEPQSWRHAIKEYGSLLEGHRQVLTGAGLIETSPPVIPGDLVVASTTTILPSSGAKWDGRKGRDLLLFVDDTCQYWYWGSTLVPALMDDVPKIVFRFPMWADKRRF